MKKTAAAKKTTTTSQVAPTTDGQLLKDVPSSLRELRVGQMLLETTWRIAVPVILFTGIGIFADLHLKTQPWLTFLGVIIGFVLACVLIAKLLKESENL